MRSCGEIILSGENEEKDEEEVGTLVSAVGWRVEIRFVGFTASLVLSERNHTLLLLSSKLYLRRLLRIHYIHYIAVKSSEYQKDARHLQLCS